MSSYTTAVAHVPRKTSQIESKLSSDDDDDDDLDGFIVDDEEDISDQDSYEEDEESETDEEENEMDDEDSDKASNRAEDTIVDDTDGIDKSNIRSSKRVSRQTKRYSDEVYASAEYRKMVLDDVPQHEYQAALEDEDFSNDESCDDDYDEVDDEMQEDATIKKMRKTTC